MIRFWVEDKKRVRENMIKDCSTCDCCQWDCLNHGYVCKNEDSPLYEADIDAWLDNICDEWTG